MGKDERRGLTERGGWKKKEGKWCVRRTRVAKPTDLAKIKKKEKGEKGEGKQNKDGGKRTKFILEGRGSQREKKGRELRKRRREKAAIRNPSEGGEWECKGKTRENRERIKTRSLKKVRMRACPTAQKVNQEQKGLCEKNGLEQTFSKREGGTGQEKTGS